MMTKVEELIEKEAPEELGLKLSVPEKVNKTPPSDMTQPASARPTETSERREEEPEAAEEDEDEDQVPSSQLSCSQALSQTDETIRRLEKEGELEQVVGSQSMLSQELIYSSQKSEDDDEDDQGFQLSQQAETSAAMARRLGLLSQEVKEEPEEDLPPPQGPVKTEGTVVTAAGTAEAAPTKKKTTTRSSSAAATAAAPVVEISHAKTPPAAARGAAISDTPFRESECFSSLLEAVDKITKAEEMNAKILAWQHNTGGSDGDSNSHNPQEGSVQGASGAKRKLPLSAKDNSNSPSSANKKSRKSTVTKKKELEQRKAQEVAKRAATLAERTITDPEMAKKLLLSMALVRENPRSIPSVLPPKGSVVPEGFFWAHYPPLEAVLKKHMAEYYDLSTTKCQSAQQQAFNNDLVVLVRDVAKARGWKFHDTFTDKGLRDRIRCYYKTHIQNAKKRLRTMVRNPTKRANARHLCAHLDLIEQHGNDNPGDGESYGHGAFDDDDDDGEEEEGDDNDEEDGQDRDVYDDAGADMSRAQTMKSEPASQAVVVGI